MAGRSGPNADGPQDHSPLAPLAYSNVGMPLGHEGSKVDQSRSVSGARFFDGGPRLDLPIAFYSADQEFSLPLEPHCSRQKDRCN